MRLLKSWRWVPGVLLAAFGVALVTWLVIGSFVQRKVSFGWFIAILVVIVGATLAQWFSSRNKRVDGDSFRDQLKSPSGLSKIFMAVFYGLGAGLFVQQFVRPTDFDGIRDILADIKVGQDTTHTKLDVANDTLVRIEDQIAPKPWRAFDSIGGYWGEERRNCEAVYRFERRDHGLTITVVKGAAIVGEYRMTASIIPNGRGDVLNATLRTSTEPDEIHGQSLVFTYHGDGGSYERLDWLNEDRSDANAVRLEPCGAPE